MAHWAEVGENNVVLRVLVTSNEEENQGYQWLVDNLGGRWIQTSYNTSQGKHLLGGKPLRGNYAGPGMIYHESLDAFIAPQPFASWILDKEQFIWKAPIPAPEMGVWEWNEDSLSWVEIA